MYLEETGVMKTSEQKFPSNLHASIWIDGNAFD